MPPDPSAPTFDLERSEQPPLPAGYTILALETSCDETAAALVRDGRTIIANVVASQLDAHRRYGGIVPEVASRQHILSLTPRARGSPRRTARRVG